MFFNSICLMKHKVRMVIKSICCNADVRSNGYVGGIDYGFTCNCCDRKCETKEVIMYFIENPQTIWKNT